MKVLYYNKIKDYDSIAATNEDSNYPVTNILSNYLAKRFQTTAGSDSSVITIDWLTEQTFDCFFMSYTNLGVGSTIQIDFYDSSMDLIDTINLTTTNYKVLKNFFIAIPGITTVEITITNDTAGAEFYVGTIWIGEAFLMPNPQAYPDCSFEGLAPSVESNNFQTSGQTKNIADQFNLNIPIVDAIATLEDIKLYIQTASRQPHFIAPYEDIDEFTIYGKITVDNVPYLRQNEFDYKYKNLSLTYREAF